MKIESLGGVQSFVSEPVNIPKAEPVETTEGLETEVKPLVDATTKKVENVSSDKGNSENYELDQSVPSAEMIRQAVDEMQKKMTNSEVQFGIHEGTNRVTIKIIDKETKEVIKELPPEKTLDMIAKAWELAGILVDEKR